MLSFESDYITGAHPKVLQRLMDTNLDPQPGYGNDVYCASAKAKIIAACNCETAEVYFLTGGTQTNAVVISTMLEDWQGVVAAETGHINGHEAGAIEYTGHKVLTVPQHNGKIDPTELKVFLKKIFNDQNLSHMVTPGMVYISQPTEYGTMYSKEELTKITEICWLYDIPLYIDGARLGYALMSRESDLTLADIARLCDVFYIGGTKVGALCGEAVVFTKNNAPAHFSTRVKQRGAMLAKGRLLGAQFDALFTNNLYFDISKHAIDMAEKLKTIFRRKKYQFFQETPTNQQFIVLENERMEKLKNHVAFSFWETLDDEHTVVRFATSWSTTQEDLDKLAALL